MKNHHPFGITFYIRQNRNKTKDYCIYCCIKVQETATIELCVTSCIKKEEWDLGKRRPKQKPDELIKLSVYLGYNQSKIA